MEKLKRIMCFILLNVFVISSLNVNIYANEFDNDIKSIDDFSTGHVAQFDIDREHQIDEIISKMNLLQAEQINYVYSNCEVKGLSKSSIVNEMTILGNKLEELGAHEIDPENINDMQILRETMQKSNSIYSTNSVYDTAPDLHAIANLYTLYIYDGSRTKNGKSFNYRYIKVVDNKGANGLTKIQSMNAIGKGVGQVATEIVGFNFQYLLAGLLTQKPAGLVVDWTLQNILNGISVGNNIYYSSNENLYQITHTAITSMTYYYIYTDNRGWQHIGTGAMSDTIRTDFFTGNVGGKPVSKQQTTPFTIKTQGIWSDYVDNFIANMANFPSYCTINELGSIEVKGYSNSSVFTFPYAMYPGYL